MKSIIVEIYKNKLTNDLRIKMLLKIILMSRSRLDKNDSNINLRIF